MQTLNTTEFDAFQDQVQKFPSPRLILRIRHTPNSPAESIISTPAPRALLTNLFYQCRELGLTMTVTQTPNASGASFQDIEVMHPGDPKLA